MIRILILIWAFLFAAVSASPTEVGGSKAFSILGLRTGVDSVVAKKRLSSFGELKVLKAKNLVNPNFRDTPLNRIGIRIENLDGPLRLSVRFLANTSKIGTVYCWLSATGTIEVNGRVVVRSGYSRDTVRAILGQYIVSDEGDYIHCKDSEGQRLVLNFLNDELISFALGPPRNASSPLPPTEKTRH